MIFHADMMLGKDADKYAWKHLGKGQYIDPMKRVDLTYKKKVNDKFNFKVKIKDLFNSSYFSIILRYFGDYFGMNLPF